MSPATKYVNVRGICCRQSSEQRFKLRDDNDDDDDDDDDDNDIYMMMIIIFIETCLTRFVSFLFVKV